MPSFSTPLSGLDASAQALNVIANNLANLNTVGYKDQRVAFQDLFYQNLGTNGAGEPLQVGAGAAVGSISSAFTAGNVDNTGVPTDVAINGDGFFVVRQEDNYVFTRGGNFTVNTAGELTSQDGQPVMGYPAVNGVVTPTQGLATMQLGRGQLSPPSATSAFQLGTNLNANAAVGDSYSTPLTVFDSLGNSHVLNLQFTKTAANAWDYSLSVAAGDVGNTGDFTTVNTGSVSFDSSGNLLTPTTDITGISIPNLVDGASSLNLTWNLFDPNSKSPLLTQTAAPSSTASTNQNGYGSGTLKSFTIGADGTVQGTFSNGRSMAVGQVVLANFADVQGLERLGSNDFQATLASGAAVIGVPGSGGRGTLTGGALELSNVDIAQEFSKMIINQRGYQANARVVTTFDEITQDTINLKR